MARIARRSTTPIATGERLIAAYITPRSDRKAIINEPISLFDGPAQREAERLTVEALDEGPTGFHYH